MIVPMSGTWRKPADAFRPGDRLRWDGETYIVRGWNYANGHRHVQLNLSPEGGGTGGGPILFRSGEILELLPPLTLIEQLKRRLGIR